MFRLALRNVLRHKLRMSLTLAAVVCGVAAIILSGGFVQDIFIQLGEAVIHSQLGHLQIARQHYFEEGSRSPDKYVIETPESIRKAISSLPEVEEISLRVHFSGLLNNGKTDWPIIGEGVEADKENKVGSLMKVLAGRPLTDSDSAGIMVGQGVAHALNLKPADHVTVLLSSAGGALNSVDLEVVGIFQTFSKEFDDRAIRIPLRAAQEALGSNGANVIVVLLRRTMDTDAIASQLSMMFSAGGLDVRTWVQLADFYIKTVALYEQQFGFLQFIILAMVMLSVANTVNMSVFERLGEFGTMSALGSRRRSLVRLILTESAIVGVGGGLLGLAVGSLLGLIISAIGIPMPPPPNANLGYTASIRLVPQILLWAFSVGFVATVVATILPASRITRTPVVDALRQSV